MISRRRFLSNGITAAAALLDNASGLAQKKPARSRLLFNWDGSVIDCWGRTTLGHATGPLTLDQYVSLIFTPIEHTAVDTVLFSFGNGNVAEYQSNVLEWPGQADQFHFPASKTWHGGLSVDPEDQYRNPKSLADAGHNPPAVIVEECRKRGLKPIVSLRMNDAHDGLHSTLPNPEKPTFKRQNPDWLVTDLEWKDALNYERPQVRALKLRVIEEFFDRWDFDGIEIDWLRHTLDFRRGTERENARYLTGFMRSVRQSLQERAARRGRPIEIAVRVPERVDWCLEGGFDVPAWLEGDLIDVLILGQGLTELPTMREFRTLMKKRPIPVYPCLYMYGNGYRVSPDDVIRANAANLWRDGADGLYLFNWYVHGPWRRRLLDEIADPRLLQGKNKHYTLVQRFDSQPGVLADTIRFNTAVRDAPVPFTLNAVGDTKTLTVPVAEVPSASDEGWEAELWIALDHVRPGDVLTLLWNDRPLEPADTDVRQHIGSVGYQVAVPDGSGVIGLPAAKSFDTRFEAVRCKVPIGFLTEGRNKLSIRMKTRGTGADRYLRIGRVELAVRRKEAPA